MSSTVDGSGSGSGTGSGGGSRSSTLVLSYDKSYGGQQYYYSDLEGATEDQSTPASSDLIDDLHVLVGLPTIPRRQELPSGFKLESDSTIALLLYSLVVVCCFGGFVLFSFIGAAQVTHEGEDSDTPDPPECLLNMGRFLRLAGVFLLVFCVHLVVQGYARMWVRDRTPVDEDETGKLYLVTDSDVEHSNRREASLDGVTCLSALCATGIAIWCLVGAVYTWGDGAPCAEVYTFVYRIASAVVVVCVVCSSLQAVESCFGTCRRRRLRAQGTRKKPTNPRIQWRKRKWYDRLARSGWDR